MTLATNFAPVAAHAATRQILAPEVVLPANSPFPIVQAIVGAGLVPVFCDVLPGLYVVRGQDLIPAITEKTVGVYVPWTYGNAPEIGPIRAACDVHEVLLLEDTLNTLVSVLTIDTFWALYDGLSLSAASITLPQHIDDVSNFGWTRFPLCMTNGDRAPLLAALAPFGAVPAEGNVTADPRMSGIDNWGTRGDLPGAHTIVEKGFVLPLAENAASVDAIVGVVRGIVGHA